MKVKLAKAVWLEGVLYCPEYFPSWPIVSLPDNAKLPATARRLDEDEAAAEKPTPPESAENKPQTLSEMTPPAMKEPKGQTALAELLPKKKGK